MTGTTRTLTIVVGLAFALFVAAFALHADEDAAVGEGFGEVTDGGDDFGAPGAEMAKAE